MIYFDHNATTPVLSEVREAMVPYLNEEWGNPSSIYRFGARLKAKIENARSEVADLIGAESSQQIIFTSGGTESNNAAIHSASLSSPKKRHIITSQVEHSSVLSYCRFLEEHQGFRVTYLPVDEFGLISLTDLDTAIRPDTALVSLMWANNETGVLFPVGEIANLCHSRGVLYHCDGVQALGKITMDIRNMAIDFISISGHKIGAPKGVGALYIKKSTPYIPFLHGGHQEQSRRGGTESISHIVGFGVAAAISRSNLPSYAAFVGALRDTLEEGMLKQFPFSRINGHKTQRLANTANIAIRGLDSDIVLTFLDGHEICASSGSACMASALSPSHVIAAMSKSHDRASESVRFSLSISNTECEVSRTLEMLSQLSVLLG
ncbi:cysteine desulfurase family protein [Brevifollis gellanilyticus]|uniref:cysteine desulfurase family protein n=1 Tax=Brevifollis gellanilyticus TaxID=748831 RepID=UPI0014780A2B|nr:aminotransferase class V-fold PLP-dependent enzyme [Brevifollis gellanilyticus]